MLKKLAKKSNSIYITTTSQYYTLSEFGILKHIKLPMLHSLEFKNKRTYCVISSHDDLYKLRSDILNNGYKIDWGLFDEIQQELEKGLKEVYKHNLTNIFNNCFHQTGLGYDGC